MLTMRVMLASRGFCTSQSAADAHDAHDARDAHDAHHARQPGILPKSVGC